MYISQTLRREEEECCRELARLNDQHAQRENVTAIEERARRFLQFDHLEKVQLQQLVRRVEVDERKRILIEFTFADPKKSSSHTK